MIVCGVAHLHTSGILAGSSSREKGVILLKRNIWLRPPVLIGGVVITLVLIWAQADLRTIVADGALHSRTMAQIGLLDPQNPDEFWRDWNKAMALVAENPTVYHADFPAILVDLTHRWVGGGTKASTHVRKEWVTDELMSQAWTAYGSAGMSGYFNRDPHNRQWGPGYLDAYGMVHGRWYLLLAKTLSSIGIGGGVAWGVMLVFPYLLILLGLLSVLTIGKAPTVLLPTTQTQITASTQCQSASPVSPETAELPPAMHWAVVFLLVLGISGAVTRVVTAPSRSITRGRAPPTLKESRMSRFAVLLSAFVALFVTFGFTLAVAAPHTVSLTAGEWAFGRGSMYGYTFDGGRTLVNPTVMADGSALDLFGRYDLLSHPAMALNVGGSLGTLVKPDGVHPYVGPMAKLAWSGHGVDLGAMVFTYRTHRLTLAEGAVLDAQYTHGAVTFGGGLEPVRYAPRGGFTQRIDGHIAVALPLATITLEARVEPTNGRRTSANVVVDVPFTLHAKK